MAQQGGYRKPENPAPTSGPGSLSQRTDGGPAQGAKYIPGLPYGQGQSTYDQQTAAPMAAAQPAPAAPAMEPITPLMAPTERPDEPITAGINRGEGPGSEVMFDRPAPPTKSLTEIMRDLIRFDPTGDTELIYRTLVDEGY
jgi:hypothetical protein